MAVDKIYFPGNRTEQWVALLLTGHLRSQLCSSLWFNLLAPRSVSLFVWWKQDHCHVGLPAGKKGKSHVLCLKVHTSKCHTSVVLIFHWEDRGHLATSDCEYSLAGCHKYAAITIIT